jgi:glutamine synthetase
MTTPVILEYVWIDGDMNLRSKYKTIYNDDDTVMNLPKWNYDGSSTNQAVTENSEVVLNPVATFKNPFIRDVKSFLILCDTYYETDGALQPTTTNNRSYASAVFKFRNLLEPWYGIEQEYFMMAPNGTQHSDTPHAFSLETTPKEQGGYYCGVGNQHIKFRELAEKHYTYCLYAGLSISGVNAEVAPSQWEYQIGPASGIDAGDQLWISRYILHKLSEQYNVNISFAPKPVASPWNGSGLHTNFSTTETRGEHGMTYINIYIERLGAKHKEHLELYGDNSKRLSGECETSDINHFSCGYGNRGCSIRIPKDVLRQNRGYFEDRRPASDADPYNVISIMYKTCCLDK